MDAATFKKVLLTQVYKPYQDLGHCPVNTQGCTKMVFGEGNPNARIMLIGEAPGKEEDEQGRPFIGRSGKLLNACLHRLNINREDVFITNAVKCRPPDNRKPLPNEIAFYKTILLNELKIVRPAIICTLGASALEALIHEPFSITKIRGKLLSYQGIPLIPTFHPAYVLRNPSAEKEFMQDLANVIRLAQNEKK